MCVIVAQLPAMPHSLQTLGLDFHWGALIHTAEDTDTLGF